MPRLQRIPAQHQANVLDWIPADLHRKIQASTVTGADDVSTYVLAAINECGSSGEELILGPGVYGIASEMVASQAVRMTGRGATLLALASTDSFNGRGSMLRFPGLSPQIEGVTFNSNSFAGNGLFIDRAIGAPIISRCAFVGQLAGFAGVRGGSNLYGILERSSFNSLGRAFDFQKGWELESHLTGNPTLTFNAAAKTVTRSSGSWLTDGFAASGDKVRFEQTALNNVEDTTVSATATVLTFTNSVFTNEGPVSGCQALRVTGSYYGWHAGVFRALRISCREGLRTNGFAKFEQTDHEHGVYQSALRNELDTTGGLPRCAAIVVGEELSVHQDQHFFGFDFVYTELQEGTVGALRAIRAVAGSVGGFNYCQILGASATVVGSTALTNLVTVSGAGFGAGNTIKKWETAVEGTYTGNAGDHAFLDLSRLFTTNDVTNLYKPGSGVQPGENPRGPGGYSESIFHNDRGLFMGPNIQHGMVSIVPDTGVNKLDLATARHFSIASAAPLTLGASHILNAQTGHEYLFTFVNGNTTLSNAVFHLRGGADRLMATNESVRLYVDASGVIREQGY